ncbi:MAG TPA: DNA primase [Patescibacteria group bacterium]|nr:DNA primase [Patescibacteria group bacterium]
MADNTLQEIKDRLDIAEVISSYIPTKKAGANFKATCPFHNEKSASLMISPQKQIWHCFGCDEGGDIFGFVMRYENLEFKDALQTLAQRAGVTLPERSFGNSEDKKITEDLKRINAFAARFYHKQLSSGKGPALVALNYLTDRGLNLKTIETWEIGYAPDSFDSLIKALQTKNVNSQFALLAGVVAKNDRGNIFDRFRNRITFPIRDDQGKVVGFTARVMPGTDDSSAKYINTPDTKYYNKSKIIFGFHAAKDRIRKTDEVVVVEGQMDVISAHQAGFDNTVATSGTAMTEDHLRTLTRWTKNIIFCFDSDTAGINALRKAGEIALRLGFRSKVIVLPKGFKDPDEVINSNPALWRKAVADSIWFVDYYLDVAERLFEYGSVEQIQYITKDVLSLVSNIQDSLEQGHYIRAITQRFPIDENTLRKKLLEVKHNISDSGAGEKNATSASLGPVPQENIQEKEILGGMILYPEFRAFVAEEGLPTEYISAPLQGIINSTMINEPLNPKNPDLDETALANEAQFMVESSLENLDGNELALMRELKKSFYLLKKAGINKLLQDTTTAIKKAESLHDNSAVKQQTELFAELSSERYTLEQKLES